MEILKNKLQSKTFKRTLYGIGFVILALIIFQAGIFIGFHKASFSYGWGDNYRKTFGEPRRGSGMMQGLQPDDFQNSHGTIGKIIKINLPELVVTGSDNVEKIILIKEDTLIRQFRENIKSTDLKINDEIVVIGSPNDSSQIEAKLIRLMPENMMTDSDNLTGISTTTKK